MQTRQTREITEMQTGFNMKRYKKEIRRHKSCSHQCVREQIQNGSCNTRGMVIMNAVMQPHMISQ